MKLPRILHEPTIPEFVLIVAILAVLAVAGWGKYQEAKTTSNPTLHHAGNQP